MLTDPEIFRRLKMVLAKNLNIEENLILESSSMQSLLAWDSLRFIIVIDAVEKEFCCRFKSNEMGDLRSVQSFISALRRQEFGAADER